MPILELQGPGGQVKEIEVDGNPSEADIQLIYDDVFGKQQAKQEQAPASMAELRAQERGAGAAMAGAVESVARGAIQGAALATKGLAVQGSAKSIDPMTGLIVGDSRQDPTQGLLYKAGEAIGNIAERPANAGFGTSVLEGIGQVAIPAAGAMLAGPPGAYAVGFLTEAQDAYERELQRQKDAGEEIDYGKAYIKGNSYGLIAGAIEAKLGAGRIIDKLKRAVAGKISLSGAKQIVLDRMKDAGAGFTEEAVQRAVQDLIVDGKLNPQAIAEEGGVGGIVQAILGLPAAALSVQERAPTKAGEIAAVKADAVGADAVSEAVRTTDAELESLLTEELPLPEEVPNAIQEQGPNEVGVRNAPTMGEGVGTQDQEAQVPSETITPAAEPVGIDQSGFSSGLSTENHGAMPARLLSPSDYAYRIIESETGTSIAPDVQVRDATTGRTVSGVTAPGFGMDLSMGEISARRRQNSRQAMWVQFNNAVSMNLHVNKESSDMLWGGPPPGWVESTENGVKVYSPPQTEQKGQANEKAQGNEVQKEVLNGEAIPPKLEEVPGQVENQLDPGLFSTPDETAGSIASFLGVQELPQGIVIISDPSLPWAAKIEGGSVHVNSAQIRKGNEATVVLEEGLHGVWADPVLQQAWQEWSSAVTDKDIQTEAGIRGALDTRPDILREEAAIRRLIENRPADRGFIEKILKAIKDALKRVFGIDVPNTQKGREQLINAAKAYLTRAGQARDARFAAGQRESRGIFSGQYEARPKEVVQPEAESVMVRFANDDRAAVDFLADPSSPIRGDARQIAVSLAIDRIASKLFTEENPEEQAKLRRELIRLADIGRNIGTDPAQSLHARQWMIDRLMPHAPLLSYLGLLNQQHARLIDPHIAPDKAAPTIKEGMEDSGRKAADKVGDRVQKGKDNKGVDLSEDAVQRILRKAGREEGINLRQIFESSKATQKERQKELLDRIMADPKFAGLSARERTELANALFKAWEFERLKEFRRQFDIITKPVTDEAGKKALNEELPKLVKMINLGLLDAQAVRNIVAKHFGTESIDGQTTKKLEDLAEKAQAAKGDIARNRILSQMVDVISETAPTNWNDLVKDYWYANTLFRSGTFLNVLFGSFLQGMAFVAQGSLDPKVIRNPANSVRMWAQFFQTIPEAIAIANEVVRRGDLSYLPDAKERIYKSLAIAGKLKPGQVVKKDELEHAAKSSSLPMVLIGAGSRMTRRIMVALDYLASAGTRDAMLTYSAIVGGDPVQIEKAMKKFSKSETRNAEEQARLELGKDAKKVDVKARTREIIEEGIDEELKRSATEFVKRAAANAEPTGITGEVYKILKPMSFWAKLPLGLAFMRAAANTVNNVADFFPVAGIARVVQGKLGKDHPFGMNLPEEHRRTAMVGQAMGLLVLGTAASYFLGGDDEERKNRWKISGGWRGLTPNKKKELREAKEQPYSIISPDGKFRISYRNTPLMPVLAMVGYGADQQRFFKDKWDKEGWALRAINGWMAGLQSILDVSTLTQLAQLFTGASAFETEDIGNINRFFARLVGRPAAGFIPMSSALSELDQWFDPKLYVPSKEEGIGQWMRHVPFVRRAVGEGPELNLFGEEVRLPRPPFRAWFSVRDVKPEDKILGELIAKGAWLPLTGSSTAQIVDPETGEKKPMTGKQLRVYVETAGPLWKEWVMGMADDVKELTGEELQKEISRANGGRSGIHRKAVNAVYDSME